MFFNFHTISFSNISGVAVKLCANVLLLGTERVALLLLMDIFGIVGNHKSYLHRLFHLVHTLKSLIKEYARLDFSDFFSTLLAIFHVINKKFHPAFY